MKILIAANGPTLDSPVAKRFGHAPYYLCVDTDTMGVQAIDNNRREDETHAIIPEMAKKGVGVFITGNIGPHAFELIRTFNGQVVMARHMLSGEALDRWRRNDLEILSGPTHNRSRHDHDHHL